MSTSRTKQRQNAESRKPEIVSSFYQTVLEEGFEGASIAKVARRIHLHPSLILHYFENKENLTLALVDYVIEEYAGLLERIHLGGLSPQESLNRLLETIWSREYYEKIHIAASLSIVAASFRNPRIDRKIRALYHGFKSFLVKQLDAAAAAGVIPTGDSGRAADIIITMIEGSRHFRHLFVKDADVTRYNADMVAAVRMMLDHLPGAGTEGDGVSK